MDLSGR